MDANDKPKLVTVALILAFAACSRFEGRPRARDAVVAVNVADVSGSGDITDRCDEVAERLRPLLEDSRLRRLDALVLATGGASGEPTVLVPWSTFMPSDQLFESPDNDQRERDAWLAKTVATCRSAIRPTRLSPVYEAVDRALAAIASRCADISSSGYVCARKLLAIESDLRSTWGEFGKYLHDLQRHRPVRQPPKPLHFGTVELYICGLSNTDAKDGLPAEVVLTAWTAVLGRRPDVDPTCPTDHVVAPEVGR